eukprot:6290160-Alexandrium_andersonii.AAC.1
MVGRRGRPAKRRPHVLDSSAASAVRRSPQAELVHGVDSEEAARGRDSAAMASDRRMMWADSPPVEMNPLVPALGAYTWRHQRVHSRGPTALPGLSLIHISEPTRLALI